jgi:hypothetical protein
MLKRTIALVVTSNVGAILAHFVGSFSSKTLKGNCEGFQIEVRSVIFPFPGETNELAASNI